MTARHSLGSVVSDGSGAWSYTTAGLSNGAHGLSAVAIDAAGNTGVASAAVSVTINTPIPTAPVIGSFSTDSGAVGDHMTNDNTLTLIGTAEANSTVKVYDGAAFLGSTLADGSGAWAYTTAVLADGAHNFTATDTLGGVTGAASTALSVAIDTTAPVAPAIAAFSDDSGVVGDHITNDNTPTINGTAEANSTIKIYDGAMLLGSTTVDGTGVWSFTTTALADGSHSLSANATDVCRQYGYGVGRTQRDRRHDRSDSTQHCILYPGHRHSWRWGHGCERFEAERHGGGQQYREDL